MKWYKNTMEYLRSIYGAVVLLLFLLFLLSFSSPFNDYWHRKKKFHFGWANFNVIKIDTKLISVIKMPYDVQYTLLNGHSMRFCLSNIQLRLNKSWNKSWWSRWKTCRVYCEKKTCDSITVNVQISHNHSMWFFILSSTTTMLVKKKVTRKASYHKYTY